MKILTLITLVILTLNLQARENPFEVTNAYEEEVARIMELNETSIHEAMTEEAYIKEMQEKMKSKKTVEEAVKKIIPAIEEKPKEKVYTKKEVDKLISKTKKQAEYKTKQIIEDKIKNRKIEKPMQVVYVKPRVDVLEEELLAKKLLPFVTIEYNDNKLIIKTKNKISKKFTLDKENKIIIDYKARKNFYTKRELLNSKNFKKITIGNHKKQNFYRVVVELKSKPSNYKVTYENELITIFRTN